jgi:hypothetical protein
MTKNRSQLQNNLTIENWKEEFSRAKKYKEATQRRSEEKRLQQEEVNTRTNDTRDRVNR